MSVGHNLCTLIHSTCRYIYFCFYIHRVLHFLPHAATLPGPRPPLSSQWECAPVVIVASVCGVLRQPAEEEGGGVVGWGGVGRIAALAPCILGLGVRAFVGTFPRLSRIASSPPTMTAAGGPGSRVVGKFHLECYSERKGRSCAELESALVTEGSRLYSV